MHRIYAVTTHFFAATASVLVAALPLVAHGASQLTPIQTLQQQRTAILQAKSIDDVIDLIPAEQRSMIQKMDAKQQQAGLDEWKQSMKVAPKYDAERIDGDRAAVLIEQPGAGGLKVEKMNLEGGQWVTHGETLLQSAVPGARGSFTISGARQASADKVQVTQTAINGRPIVQVYDVLQDAFDEQTNVPIVTLAIEQCLSSGAVDLAARNVEGAIVGSQVAIPGDGGKSEKFNTDAKGKLTVKNVKDGRFDGVFQLAVNNEHGDELKVSGSLENAQVPCDQ